MMYLVIYPPIGKQTIGNMEAVDNLTTSMMQQAQAEQIRLVRVISGNLFAEDTFQELISSANGGFSWRQVKTLRKSDQE